MADFVLDWEDELPDDDLDLSDAKSALAHVNVVLGSTLQIVPAGNLPLQHKKYHPDGKLVVVNLQPTKHDRKADLVIRDYLDKVMSMLLERLEVDLPEECDPASDPVTKAAVGKEVVDWTQDPKAAKRMKALADRMDDDFKRRKKQEKLGRKRKLEQKVSVKEEEEDIKTKAVKDENVQTMKNDTDSVLNLENDNVTNGEGCFEACDEKEKLKEEPKTV